MLSTGALLSLAHGLVVTRIGLQSFVVTLCGLLIYRGIARCWTADGTAGFTFGQLIPSLEAVVAGRMLGVPHPGVAFTLVAPPQVTFSIARSLDAISWRWAKASPPASTRSA